MSSVILLEPYKVKVINAVQHKNQPGYCNKCGDDLFSASYNKLSDKIQETKKALWEVLAYIPVVTIQNPMNWEYDVLTMVTGQSVTGTGVLSEFKSGLTDLLGMQSGSYNAKLKAGEDLCFAQLRRQTYNLGGNAVIATDIDYSEVGGSTGMLMVCMSGTAIRLKNPEVLGENRTKKFDELKALTAEYKTLLELEKS